VLEQSRTEDYNRVDIENYVPDCDLMLCQIFTQVLLKLLTFWRLALVWILFKYSLSASQKTHCSPITNIRQSVLFQKMMQNYMQHTNVLWTTCRRWSVRTSGTYNYHSTVRLL